METSQEEKVIIIISPQSWSHQFISKHHYAVEFSNQYNTIFVSPTRNQLGRFSFSVKAVNEENSKLALAQLVLPFPHWFRFKFTNIYRVINRVTLNHFFKKYYKKRIKLVIDFGCHNAVDRLDKFQNAKSIYFPVDDHRDLPIKTRYADKIFTVSSNIQEKFEFANIPISWINHGLSAVFAEKANVKLEELKKNKEPKELVRNKIGYAGNLSIPFLDRKNVLETIAPLPNLEFHFFGNYSSKDKDANDFISKLKQFDNVKLHGQLSSEELANQLFQMNILWLCYKSDGRNYHLENSHKILEYLSTGLPIVSSPIKYLTNATPEFIYQFDNQKHKDIFFSLKNKEESLKIIRQRIEFSLRSTYTENIKTLLKSLE